MSAVSAGKCRDCVHFRTGPAAIEGAFPGLAALSSGYASVRADDGLCALHGRYLPSSASCARHQRSAGQHAHEAVDA